MANPWDFLDKPSPASAPGAGIRGAFATAPMTPAAAQSPFSTAASQVGGRGGNYNALFDPQASGIRGIIGGMMGNPTRAEFQQQQQGAVQSAGFAKLADAIQQGTPPQKAILDFANTDEGMNFLSQPDAAATLKTFLSQITTAPVEPVNVGAGGALVDPSTMQEVYRNPTGKVQDFTGMAELANLSEPEIQSLARAQLEDAQTGEKTQTERATAALVRRGLMTPDEALKHNGGQVQVMTRRNLAGEVEGYDVVDILNGTSTPVQQVQPGVGVSQPQPGTPTRETTAQPNQAPSIDQPVFDASKAAPGEVLQSIRDSGGNPADVVEGAGFVPLLGEKLGGIGQQLFGGSAGSNSTMYRDGLELIRADAETLRDLMSRTSRGSTAETKAINSIADGMSGMSVSPIQSAMKLIDLNHFLDQREAQAKREISDPNTTNDVRGNAYVELSSIDKARNNLPSVEDLKAKIKVLQTAPSPVKQAIPTVKEEIGKAVKGTGELVQEAEGPAEAPKPGKDGIYSDSAELRSALKAGTIKSSIRVRLQNGEMVEVVPDKVQPK